MRPLPHSEQRRHEVAAVVGDRIRRLRLDRGMRLLELARRIPKPSGRPYSASYVSRIERGWAHAPIYVYDHIARALDVDPWLLFAQDEVRHDPRPDELVLLRFLRRAGISPDEVLWLLADAARPTKAPAGTGGRENGRAGSGPSR